MPHNPVLLIAIDGLRYDFLTAEKCPNLWKLAQEGAWSPDGMQCQFPAQTSPNFRSIVTGLHVENHGILDNIMQDVATETWFDYFGLFWDTAEALEPSWYGGKLPIWTTYQNQTGQKAGSVYFPFSNVKTQKTSKLDYKNEDVNEFHQDPDFLMRKIEQLVNWMSDPVDPVRFGLFYFCEPDLTAHYEDYYGPVVAEKIKTVDDQIGHLVKLLKSAGLYEKINILVVSDHGYTTVKSPEGHVDLVTGIDPGRNLGEKLTVCTGHPVGLKVKQGVDLDMAELYNYLREYSKDKAVEVFTKENFPKKYHYAGHPRAGDIIYVANLGNVALVAPQAFHYYGAKNDNYSEHGYKPDFKEMRPIFFARGPAFKENFRNMKNFENIDLYPLMCHLLGIVPESNDGNYDAVFHLLKDRQPSISKL